MLACSVHYNPAEYKKVALLSQMNIHISFECGISLFIQLYNTFKAAAGAAVDVYFCTDVQGIVSMDSGPGQHIHNILLLSASSVIVYPSFV